MRLLIGLPVLAAGLVSLAMPAGARTRADLVTRCQIELRPKGQYSYAPGQRVPVVKPGAGGSQAEADALNACIRARVAGGRGAGSMNVPIRESGPAPAGATAAGASARPRYTKKQRGAPVLSGGAGYSGSYLEGGSGRGYAPATAPERPRTIRKARRGVAPLPSGYPLLPGDEELWYSLTPAQQQRALEFLSDGSTIRSSLEPD